MANTGRVTQSAVELLTLGAGSARVTQSVVEFLVGLGVLCNNPPNGTLGLAYSHTFLSGGAFPPVTWSISAGALPDGLSLNAATGHVSGTPTKVGGFAFTVTVTDAQNDTASVACSIVILATSATEHAVILLIGWKLYPEDPCEPPEAVPEAPHVDRAL